MPTQCSARQLFNLICIGLATPLLIIVQLQHAGDAADSLVSENLAGPEITLRSPLPSPSIHSSDCAASATVGRCGMSITQPRTNRRSYVYIPDTINRALCHLHHHQPTLGLYISSMSSAQHQATPNAHCSSIGRRSISTNCLINHTRSPAPARSLVCLVLISQNYNHGPSLHRLQFNSNSTASLQPRPFPEFAIIVAVKTGRPQEQKQKQNAVDNCLSHELLAV